MPPRHFSTAARILKRPLDEAIQLMDTGFENADIVFLTDGLCELPEDYLETLRKEAGCPKIHRDRHPAGRRHSRHGFQPDAVLPEDLSDQRAGR